jgi:glycosyltransferase involved in cell wall biosynthesis
MKFSSENTIALIPAYNEEKNIEEVIKKTRQFIKTILVVNDGSTDKTKEITQKLEANIISHEKNKGKGEALKTGLDYIKKNLQKIKYIVVIDADMQYEPEESKKILQPLISGKADFVMGHRNWKHVPFRHKIGNFVWKMIFNLLFGTKLKDVSCGIIGFTKETIDKINDISGGYIIESSILAQCVTNNLKIKQVPVNVKYIQKSGIIRGSRMVLGVFLFTIKKGIIYRLNL